MTNGRTLNNFTLSDITGNSVFEGGYLTISLIPQLDDTFTLGAAAKRWNNIYSSGICRLSGTTASTSTSTGTLICSGGVGIAGSLYVGGTINLAAVICTTVTASGLITGSAGLTISSGATSLQATTTTTLGCTTLTASGLITGSAGLTISSGATSLQATTTTTLGCTTVTASGLISAQAGATVTGALSCTTGATLCSSSGTCTIGATTPVQITTAGKLVVQNTQDYDNSSGVTASILTSGGIYAAKQIYCETAATLCATSGTCTIGTSTAVTIGSTGVLTVNNTTASSSTTTGSVIIKGGVGVAGALYVGGTINLTSVSCTTLTASGLVTAQAGVNVTTGQTLNVGTSGTTSPANIYGDLTVGASANSTNAKNVITSHGYFTNKTPSASYSNGSIVLVNNYTTSLSTSTPAMQGIMFTSNTRPSQVTWSTVMGYASSLTANSENCGILWCTTNSGTLAERMRMDNAGCLSIGNTTSSGMLNVGSSTQFNVSSAGVVTVNNTDDSTSYNTGSTIIKGGLGVAKSIYQKSGTTVAAFNYLSCTATWSVYNSSADSTLTTTDINPYTILGRTGMTATRTDTLPTAAALYAAFGGGFMVLCHNRTATYSWIIQPAGDMTMYINGSTTSVASKTVPTGQMITLWFDTTCTKCCVTGVTF